MKLGCFYGVGVGPGDPELMTRKSIRILETCPVAAFPQRISGEMTAHTIVRQVVNLEGKEILFLPFAMSRDRAKQASYHQRALEQVRPWLMDGQDVAMAILGDVSIFSTYCYLMEQLKQEGFPCKMIPGVPSFCAAAAELGWSLTTMNQPVHILPGGSRWIQEGLDLPGSKIFMKAGTQYPQLLEELGQRGLLGQAGMVENCGLEGENIYPNLTQRPSCQSYFATVILPPKKED